jgi:squalene-associated FAD-dependent desaturase
MPTESARAHGREVVVVGGGVAGLSAATALAERGVRVTLVEARPTLGGRAASFVDPATGVLTDNGQHILLGCYDETFALLRRLGSSSHAKPQRSLAMDVVDAAGSPSRLSCPVLPAPVHLLAGLLRWPALRVADALGALRMAQRPVPHASETVAAWLSRLGQSDRLIEVLWEPLAVASLNQSIHVAAAKPFAVVLDRVLRRRSSSALVVPSAPLSALFADPARAFLLERGASVLMGSPARVFFGAARTPMAIVREQPLDADVVILAVPWHALPNVVVGAPERLAQVIRAAAATEGEAIVSAHLWFDRPVLRTPFVGLPGRAWQWAFAGSSPQRPVSLVASAANHLVGRSNAELGASALRVLEDAVPESRRARMLRAVVVRERRATFSVAPDAPARPGHDVGVPGLYLAGDWIGNALPATIEAAATSGHRAAELAARHLGL